ncbi:hypothetical protein C8A05DRAFT_11408 [Staphylotrichum tortipilum]|uniref:F-box domain-containing protein n=1 Tax=Staphylotrichum tortipilum TaxID=2831512 RepID=A0AAN6MTJ8_9PEZI|nr:hypothetical protein C8A05DRAFT_11408 [Staphylotrichum longicolle]
MRTEPKNNNTCRKGASLTVVEDQDETHTRHLNGSPAPDDTTSLGRKRKSPGDIVQVGGSQSQPDRITKRIRMVDGGRGRGRPPPVTTGSSLIHDRSLLPPEIWHLVFTYCPPKSLGNLLSVNKSFNLYLDPSSPAHRDGVPCAPQRALGPMEPNAIWQASRRLFWPKMPAPLQSKTELDMWRITCSPSCQDCGQRALQGQISPPDPLHPGPGADGVVSLWAFGRRICAMCILKTSEKELDLQISPSIPSAIIPALPFVFLTQDRHVFSATAVELGRLPANLQVTKLFPKSGVEAFQQEFLQVKDMGSGTVGEWLKGLPGRGSAMQHDASKWEKWESSGGASKMRSLLYPGYEGKSTSSLPRKPPAGLPLNPLLTQERHERTAEATQQWTEAKHIPDGEHKSEPSFTIERREDRHLDPTPAPQKVPRDQIDKTWEEAQAPLRVKIAGFADEAVRDNLKKGKKMTRDTCSRFAVNSLLDVRNRFYAGVAKDAETARAAGKPPIVDPPEGPFTQKLTLENMKWIFDTKIKPHTETLRKELFYCNGCEGNFKPFGFEGVIQHYAAKHTSALSLGNIVVHWRAEWPEHPPFSAAARKALSQTQGPGNFPGSGGTLPPATYNFAPAAAPPTQPPPVYPPPGGYGYSPPAYVNYNQLPPPYQPQPAIPPPFVSQPGYEYPPSYITPPAPYPTYQPPPVPYFTPEVDMAQGWKPQPVQYDYHYALQEANGAGGPSALHQASAYPELHQSKVEDVAHNSREVWKLLSYIRDLPGSMKVLATIHHLVKRFRSRFYETPPLSLFIDGLSNNKEMRPVRNINGLVCKACRLGLGNAASVEKDRKEFSLPQLANHFQFRHVEQMAGAQSGPAPLDWVLDMVFVSDLEVSMSASLPASEPQKVLLSAALPIAVAQQPVPASNQSYPPSQTRQPEPIPGKGHHFLAENPPDGLQGIPGHHFPGESSHSSLAPLEDDSRSALGDGGRHSSRGSNPNRGQGGSRAHKKPAGQGKRSKLHNGGGRGSKLPGKKPNVSHGNQKHENAKSHVPTKPNAQPPQGFGKEPLGGSGTVKKEEFNVMAALDSYLLQQNQAPQPRGQQDAARAPSLGETGGFAGHADSQPPRPESHARDGGREASTQASRPALNKRDPARTHLSWSAAGGRQDDAHGPRWAQPTLVESRPRQLEAGSLFGPPAPHTEGRDRLTAPPEAGYGGYHSDRRLQSRPSVETYEIVHVIDESGEYYIRRPVRRVPDPQHKYEERGVRHEAASYPAHGSLSRPNLVREGVGTTRVPENRPTGPQPGPRPGPTFYQEYDPRFPAA